MSVADQVGIRTSTNHLCINKFQKPIPTIGVLIIDKNTEGNIWWFRSYHLLWVVDLYIFWLSCQGLVPQVQWVTGYDPTNLDTTMFPSSGKWLGNQVSHTGYGATATSWSGGTTNLK
jgi:hypothetical protein